MSSNESNNYRPAGAETWVAAPSKPVQQSASVESSGIPPQQPDSATSSPEAANEMIWEKTRATVDGIADRLGHGIDNEIKEPVTAFLVHEFTTSQSCEGHAGQEHGLPYPWVEIYAPEPAGRREANDEQQEQLEREWTTKNLEQQQKMMGLLGEFYQNRTTPFDARLAFDRIGAFGGFRVQSFGASTMQLLPPEIQQQKLEQYRNEMNNFAEFLKNKFLMGK